MSLDTVFGLHAVESLVRGEPDTVLSIQVQEGREDKRLSKLLYLVQQTKIKLDTYHEKH